MICSVGNSGYSIAARNYINILINNGYTIVLVEQVTEPPNPERKVTQILSPGTSIIHNKHYSNYLLSVFIEKYNYLLDKV